MKETVYYSEAFKRQVVSEVEQGKFRSLQEAQERYGIGGSTTIKRWLKKHGKEHLLPKRIRVENMKERDERDALRRRIRELEKALADTQVDAVLNQAYLEVFCEEHGIKDIETYKKKVASQLYEKDKKLDKKSKQSR